MMKTTLIMLSAALVAGGGCDLQRDAVDSGTCSGADTSSDAGGDADGDADTDTDADSDADSDADGDPEWDTETTTYTDVATVHGKATVWGYGGIEDIEIKAFSETAEDVVASTLTDELVPYELLVPPDTYTINASWAGWYFDSVAIPPVEAGTSIEVNLYLEEFWKL